MAVLPALVAVVLPVLVAPPAVAGPCDPPNNAIVCENSKPGTARENWWIESPYGDIEGFATQNSVRPGQRLDFKVKTPSSNWEVDILRLGYYQGLGARLITTVDGTPRSQPQCAYDGTVGLVDCGNWTTNAGWTLPVTTPPGFYIANFIREDGTPGASQYPFVVRATTENAGIVVQTSDQTWQAYNKYGDRPGINEFSTYEGGFSGSPDGRAFKVSYNRPYRNSGTASFLNAEYPLVRFLERNGYDVNYVSGIDVTREPTLLRTHKVYVSSGHDEYVNATQRANVEAARAAGVNMMFMSGNEWFWKTRFENSIDGSNTPYRTMACYKETKTAPVRKLDPSPEWTGTWRDGRLSPPYDAGRPENAITGTLFRVNGYRDDAMQVPAQYGRNRFWRNTSIATATTTTTLVKGSLGYEWNEDPDNGFRPAGAVPLSDTTITVDDGQLLLDEGWLYGGGPANHKMVLYRDQTSRALVWGAGTVQWSWGLDATHLNPIGQNPPADIRIQQATVNLLADMGVQPQTLMPGLFAATGTTDATGPAVTVTNPPAGATLPAGSPVVISGTASDVATGNGKVGAIEVSTDGGATWHRANGLDTWTYNWTPSTLGTASVRVRASDDSANIGAVAVRDLTIGAQQCPCSVLGTSAPTVPDSGDSSAIEVGMKFTASVNATVTGVRFYKSAANTGTHTGSLWTAAGLRLATGTFTGETATGWQTLTFPTPVGIRANTTYVVSYTAPSGHYSVDSGYFNNRTAGVVPLTAPSSQTGGGNGVFRYGQGFPDSSYNSANYWVDVVVTTAGADNTAPTVSSTAPASNATAVPTDAEISATFSEDVDPASVRFQVRAGGGPNLLGSTSTEGASTTFLTNDLMTPNTTYTVTLDATDGYGNALAPARTWTFTTGAGPAGCPCTIFRSTRPGAVDAGDGSHVELGVKFRASVPTVVTGVRFYKSDANVGPHTGTLWTASGLRLATGTFVNETATGWQTLTFPSPVQISPNTTYVASYLAPSGHYSADLDFFATNSAGRAPLSAPNTTTVGGNGVFSYGGGFPDGTFRAANYWVDVVVDTAGVDTTPPAVTGRTPAAGATGVSTGTEVTATFDEVINPITAQLSVSGPAGAVAGTTAVAPDNRGITFVPDGPLAANTTYTVSTRAADASGNLMPAPVTWTFTTGSGSVCPCTLFRAIDGPTNAVSDSPVELGMKWRPSVDGQVTAIRFYKTAGDAGTHTGTLWSSTGQPLATGTFTGETGSGWQTLVLGTPVDVTAGTTYVVSYHTTRYGYTGGYFATDRTNGPLTGLAAPGNGVYRYGPGGVFPDSGSNGTNYWVDVVFGPA
ncbi:MAG TPA: DUF4082 domain-containing protein [Pseudonocardiaceae bacterium]